jgi:hypothetical protein
MPDCHQVPTRPSWCPASVCCVISSSWSPSYKQPSASITRRSASPSAMPNQHRAQRQLSANCPVR